MTTCARLAQNVRPLGGLVGRGAALVALGLLPLVAGCTKAQQQGTGSSYLILNSIEGASGAKPDTFGVPLASDVQVKGTVFNDLGEVVMHLGLKDPGDTATPRAMGPPVAYQMVYVPPGQAPPPGSFPPPGGGGYPPPAA